MAKKIETMFVDVGLPAEFMLPKLAGGEPYTEWTWHFILDKLSDGLSLAAILRDNPGMPKDISKLRRWIANDPTRKADYEAAQQIGAEALVDAMLDIAEGSTSLEDVQRSTLRINTIKWLAGCRNRDKYGDKKQIEQTVSINIADAMEQADRRVIDLKAEVLREIEHDNTDNTDSDSNGGSDDSMGDL
jgi:hypothetical protein